jgi:hypothetical protein
MINGALHQVPARKKKEAAQQLGGLFVAEIL